MAKLSSSVVIVTTTSLFVVSYSFFAWIFQALSWHALAGASAFTYIVVSSWEKRVRQAKLLRIKRSVQKKSSSRTERE